MYGHLAWLVQLEEAASASTRDEREARGCKFLTVPVHVVEQRVHAEQWAALPADLPPRQSLCGMLARWRREGARPSQ